jgi:anaerobic selenocysteine-containing dehydrogenase
MTKSITRRRLFQLGGLAGATVAVSGCTINLQRSDFLVPYVVPPEESLPGQNVWYASTCGQCSAGCGIIVRTSNGRARKIEGNPLHPVNRGRLCARGQAGLQVLYNPDRLRNAVTQSARGSRSFKPIPWEDALTQVAERVKAARPGAVAFYGSQASDTLAAVVGAFLQVLGAPPPVFYEIVGAFAGRGTLSRVTGDMFANGPALPFFDLANSDVVFSFGADLVGGMGATAYGKAYGEMRGQRLGKRGYLVQFEPHMSATGAVADEWLPIVPGTEGLVALAIGQIMVEEGLAPNGGPFAGLFSGVDVANVAALSDISVEQITKLARIFGGNARPVAMPGGGAAGSTNAAQATAAILALNGLAGNATPESSALLLPPLPPAPELVQASQSRYADVQALIKRMQAGEVDVLFIHGNPRYELPIASGFVEGLRNVPLVVSFSSEVDETATDADMILPDHSYLESWGYQYAAPPADRPSVGGQQPVVTPIYDTRATSDVFLDLAVRLGGAAKQALPQANTIDYMTGVLAKLMGRGAPYPADTPDLVWGGWRQYGGWWTVDAQPGAVKSPATPPASLSVPPAELAGNPNEFSFLLYPYVSVARGEGRGASQPWLQETPDPMTTASWDTWVEINPETAGKLGLKMDDVVRVKSMYGEISAIVYVYPAIRPDVVAVPTGEGHSALGRFAKDHGANVLSILAPLATADGELAFAATRVKLEKLDRRKVLPRIESNTGVDAANEDKVFPG